MAENQDICELNAEMESLKAEIETLKMKKSLVECVRESYSKDLTLKILQRRTRYKKVNGVKEPFCEVTVSEAELNSLLEIATGRASIDEKISELKKLGDRLWHELSQTELYKRSVELERQNLLLKAEIKTLENEMSALQEQESAEPYIYYEDEIKDLEIK